LIVLKILILKNNIQLFFNKEAYFYFGMGYELKPEDAAKGYEGLKNNQDKYLGVIFNWTTKPE
jgi:hypothetical protein